MMKNFTLKSILVALMVCLTAMSSYAQETATDSLQAPKFWKKGMDLSLQFTQNYVSPNWYNGGNSSMAGVANIQGWINYNKDEKILWENFLDLKYGFSTTFTEDKVGRIFHMTDDMSKYTTKFGYLMGKGWYASVQAELSTTLFDTYTIDTNNKTSGLGSPVRFYVSPGFDYKYTNDKGTEISLLISPTTYKLVYVNDTVLAKREFNGTEIVAEKTIQEYVGLPADKNMLNDFGGLVQFNLFQKFNDRISLESKLKLYTNYLGNSKGTVGLEADWEITANFVLYKLLTAQISIHPRYDSTTEDGWDAKLQFKEFVSIGLAYSFGER